MASEASTGMPSPHTCPRQPVHPTRRTPALQFPVLVNPADVLLPAGLGSCTGLYVGARGVDGEGADAHVHIADSVAGTKASLSGVYAGRGYVEVQAGAVCKPSAQPTLVRTQHLPPPAKTACSLRKRGPAGRFLLVAACLKACHCGSIRSSGYGHIADRVGGASGAYNRSLRQFTPVCPVSRGVGLPRIPVGRSFAVLLASGGELALFVPAAGAACRIGQRDLAGAPRMA